MIKTSHLIHKGIINIDTKSEDAEDLNFGNNLALLSGDYLLSTSFHQVALLKNFIVQETISSTLRDLAESEFLGLRDKQNKPIPSRPFDIQKNVTIPLQFDIEPYKVEGIFGNMKAEWTLRNVLGGATLLGKCCQCCLILANHDKEVQELGYSFGRNFALAWQASLEMDLIKRDRFSLVSAPVMLHLEYDPSFYSEIEKGLENVENVDFVLLKKCLINGPSLERTRNLRAEFIQNTLDVLDKFPASGSKTALVNIVKSM